MDSERRSRYTVVAGQVPGDEIVDVTLVLRRRAEPPADVVREGLAPGEYAARYGADPDDVRAVVAEVERAGGQILETDAAGRRVRARVRADQVPGLFGTSLERVTAAADGATATADDQAFRRPAAALALPDAFHDRVIAVLGLDDRPQAEARFRTAAQPAVSYTPVQVGAIYRFPAGTDGTGRTVAIVELGGGYAASDLAAYFSGLGVAAPTVTSVGVDGAANGGGHDPNGADGEVLLDIEVVGALAPAAHIVVYFAPNTDAGFLDAVTQAAHATPAPDAISISWGQSEDAWTAQARTALDEAFVDAVALGATVTAAAGDNGSGDGVGDGTVHVDFPASSPHALACGGTSLRADPATGAVTSETVWNGGSGGGATGGGVSDVFPKPDWQDSVSVPATASAGRGVPDVAGDADPDTGYQVLVDGQRMVIGGTSAVAPLWAALIARLVQATGARGGLLQPALYAGATATATSPGFRDIVTGDNGAYRAQPGWDACTGLGVPVGDELVTTLHGA